MNRHQTRAIVRIREMILRGELGAGERVAEAPLAELLGMSRTPVRQALPLLAQEGLLAAHETRGYVVRGFSTADILDAIDLRGVLEGLAARRVAEQGVSRNVLQALRECLVEGDQILAEGHVADKAEALYVDMNVRFHQLILLECRSIIIQQALERGEGARVEALMREHTNPVKENLNIPGIAAQLREPKPRLTVVR